MRMDEARLYRPAQLHNWFRRGNRGGKILSAMILSFLMGLMISACSSAKEEDWWERRQKEKEPAKVEAPKPEEKPKEEPKETAKEEAPKPEEMPPPPKVETLKEPEPPPPPPVVEKPMGIPFKDAFPRDYQKMQPVRIGILSSPGNPNMGEKVAFGLTEIQGHQLERQLGRKIEVTYISRSGKSHGKSTIIHYRPLYLREAMHVAAAMPKDQIVATMDQNEQRKIGVDLMIYLGDNIR